MSSKTYKKIEIVGTSDKSFSKAVANGIEKAGASVKHMDWFEVTEQRGRIDGGQVVEYQVTLKIGFRIE